MTTLTIYLSLGMVGLILISLYEYKMDKDQFTPFYVKDILIIVAMLLFWPVTYIVYLYSYIGEEVGDKIKSFLNKRLF